MHVRHVEERPGKATGHEIMSLPQPQQQHASTNNYAGLLQYCYSRLPVV